MGISSNVFRWVCVGIAVACLKRSFDRLPVPFRSRSCQGAKWRREFPDVAKKDIRSFLSLFTQAFALPENKRLLFKPADTFMEIYRSRYPSKWMPDSLELESLALIVKKTYGINLEDVWSDKLTLGELFSHTRGKACVD